MAKFIRSDLDFILRQIKIAEQHAAGANLLDLVPNTEVGFGLRTLDGSFNNLVPGQTGFGAADLTFPRLLQPVFRNDQDGDSIDLNGPAPGGLLTNTDYSQPGNVVDADPRLISNLIVDQSLANPAAVAAAAAVDGSAVVTGTRLDGTPFDTHFIPNVAPDEGLSAPFNQWMTFFGQFFDHGLDLVNKGGSGTVFIPLQPGDPLYVEGGPSNFMVLTRATNQPGPDGILGTADDVHEHVNQTSPFVDQNQTYSSHPSHQVFLRAYELDGGGSPQATGKLIVNRDLGADGVYGTADDATLGGMATWAVVKAQARDLLGINLTDANVGDVPLLAADAYGNFIRGPNGFPQVVIRTGNGPDGIAGTADDTTILVEGNPAAPIDLTNAVGTGHPFLADIAHAANPFDAQTGAPLAADGDTAIGLSQPGTYDNELLDAHYIAGDGRVNENIGLTAVHHVFHSEHNRLVEATKAELLASGDVGFLNEWLVTPVGTIPADPSSLQWNGERLFQVAKFGTEMQYQHLVFEEFARTIQPQVDAFLDFNDTINPAIFAEFAHTVYRFGHSMLTETIDRLSPRFGSSEIGLIQAFLNPLEFAASGLTPEQAAGAIVRGTTRQVGNEIDEFVTDALRNNLVGLPLDLAAINIARGRDTGIPSLNAARREFYEGTGDAQLTPYVSWADYMQHLKHPESLVNFIAAYGTHPTITGATTLEAKRAAAGLIVLGGAGEPADRLDFLHSTGSWASGAGGVTITGLDEVDLWIGGLAEAKMPFGGMLGSTFNFVFETQLEALQDGDRLYYLHRTAGLNFLKELENNSFAKLIQLNTDATHLPSLVFTTPGLILEIDPLAQFNAGLGGADPADPSLLVPLVIRDDPATVGADTDYLQYTGDQHVVLGGTAGNDTLIASIGDDTLYGDAGNDRLEGGYGNDMIEGGPGDDIITDLGGDDVLKGEEGNDVIHGGNGINLILAGPGKDFIITGEDSTETFAGLGDDFILGSRLDAFPTGNEGNDWIELGLQDGAAGDNFDPFGQDPVVGHDVFLGDGGFDEVLGEGGDDIAVGSEGPDKYIGMSGYDWVTYKDDRFGVNADMFKNAFNDAPLPASIASIGARYAQTEGLSGSAHGDILRGDDATAALLATAGFTGSVLTNFGLISGLRDLVGTAADGADGIAGTADDRYDGGNILLGGSASDLIEGRGGDDVIDGDAWLNVRISVRANIDGSGAEIASYDSMIPLMPLMLNGTYNPGQLVIVREVLTDDASYDTAMYSGNSIDYSVVQEADGSYTVTHLDPAALTGIGVDGTDRLTGIERLQFNDVAWDLAPGINLGPDGLVAILDANGVADDTPITGQVLTASIAGVTDPDNPAGTITGPVSYYWQFERIPGSGLFEDISVGLAPRGAPSAIGPTLTVTPDLEGSALRVKAHYQDANGVLETVYSAPTLAVGAGTPPPGPATLLNGPQNGIVSPGVHFLGSDLQFILDQIKISESHAAGQELLGLLPNGRMALGLRTVDGSFNNLVQDQTEFGASDNVFPRLLDPAFRDGDLFDPDGPGPAPAVPTSYTQTSGVVADSQPRTVSNLIVDQTASNPAAVVAAAQTVGAGLVDGVRADGTPFQTFFIPNVAPDEGLSAPFNAWMTFFGQFFDHGLDLVNKGGSGTVFIPLQPDDPLYVDGSPTNFMVLTRATNQPGPDGVLGTADDIHEHTNQTSPFIDQNQTYSSHPSHQVFLRAYEFDGGGRPLATGKLIVDRDLGPDGTYGTADDTVLGGMATWATVKAQARDLLGINLTDADVFNVPLLATDAYGQFLRGPNGFPQVVMKGIDGIAGTTDDILLEGNPAAPISLADAVRTGHAFLDDIAHAAAPSAGLVPDADTVAGTAPEAGAYDNELLDAHYIAGDGRVNENIGLTTVHHVFHSEHNRLVEHTQAVVLETAAGGDVAFLNEWLLTPVTALPADLSTLDWNGERLFQAAKFGTEMQYQHLVFEEFARTIQPNIDAFIPNLQNYQTEIDPSIVAEFAHTVYRFGHSMLTETIDRLDPNFQNSEIGLIQAFLNPLEFAASGPTAEAAAGAIVRGVTRQVGNEIDEFVTDALRNNLVGLPLDLAAINLARGRDVGIPSLNAARREFYNDSGDSNLKPYASWGEFVQHLKHPESLVNFIAAYGTHPLITAAATLDEKRAAASLIVFGGVGEPADRTDFLMSQGAWVSGVNGVTTTGLDAVDFWIGGLAEMKMPFGGMLGSTFNFVFENQMEKLQNADRFYYLERTAGLNFVTELENNSFAKLVMANTDATHLPGLMFQTNLILEADQTRQFNETVIPGPDGILGTPDDLPANADPAGDNPLLPLVVRDDPTTPGVDLNYLKYTGDEHVVLGGTGGADTLIASIGDDTLWGDGGNDRMEGGHGNDQLRGGAGDDILTDMGGDDNIQGDDGNDVIHAGNGLNLVLGGFGNDFIVTGEDASEAFGGPGNDFILGGNANEQDMGNEGDDWLEGGLLDGSPGDNFDPLGRDLVIGNDVYRGSGGPDIMNAEGGDDIMIGSSGPGDKYLGASGFDWATFKDDQFGVSIDLDVRALNVAPVPVAAGIVARFSQVEGLSGSPHSDFLRGDNVDALTIGLAGTQGSVLTNFGLIGGLRELVGTAGNGADGLAGTLDDQFGSGNIILGGDGSDLIEGRGGDDLIDGDAWLDVYISVRANADGSGAEIARYDSMVPLVPLMLNGTYSAGQLTIGREILPGGGGFNFDTAAFSGNLADYTIAVNGIIVDPALPLSIGPNDVVTVTDTVGVAGIPDGSDRLTHVERLQFNDQSVTLVPGLNSDPQGLLTVSDTTPEVGAPVTASIAGVTDADNSSSGGAITGPVSYFWQVDRGTGVFEDIVIATGVGTEVVTGESFTPTADLGGLSLRAKAIYEDEHGVLETVYSAPTAPIAPVSVNDAPVVVSPMVISDTTPTEGQPLAVTPAIITDGDGTANAVFTLQWQSSADGIAWTNIAGATGTDFTPGLAQRGLMLRVVTNYTDDLGTPETVASAATDPVGSLLIGNAANNTLIGTAFSDELRGLGGNDILNGTAGADLMIGGTGNDTYFVDNPGDVVTEAAGEGTDTIQTSLAAYTLAADFENLVFIGAGSFTGTGNASTNAITGGAGSDTLSGLDGNDSLNGAAGVDNLVGGLGNDTYFVDNVGDAITELAGEGTDTARATSAAYTLGANVENLVFTGVGNFAGTGNELANGITGGAGSDTLTGLGGNDSLNGAAGADNLIGGLGNDTYFVDNVGDAITELAGEGTDTARATSAAYTLGANVENLVFTGAGNFAGTGNELANGITGGTGNDTLSGLGGNDTLNGGAGADALIGGLGNDTYWVDNAGDVVTELAGEGTDTVRSTLGAYVLGANVENLVFTGAGDFAGTGNELANGITGGTGNDTLSGLGGNDTLNGGAGADALIGGLGNDTYWVDNAGDVVTELAGEGTDTVRSTLGAYVLGANVENLVFTGAGNFAGAGNELANGITGGTGNDTLSGLGGNDTLNGAAGADALIGGLGNDTYIVDNAGDTVTELAGQGTDAVRTTLTSYTLGANLESLVFIGAGNFAGTGNELANGITGGAGSDTLIGLGGSDTLNGAAGADNLVGGLGNDIYIVDNAGDAVTEAAGEGTDTVRTTLAAYSLGANLENLLFIGAGNFAGTGNELANAITGGAGNDTLNGAAGNDNLIGGDGSDTLIGGIGADILNGGAGNDFLVFTAGFGNDVAQGFDADAAGGQDLLDISALGITAASFAADVTIQDLGNNTLVTIGTDTITLVGVNGVGANTITQADFVLA
jgi:Ca2+-binding RTX toxin-like protein